MAKKNKARTVVAPVVTDLAKPGESSLTFWKQILPEREIHYTAKSGARKTLNFDNEYLHELSRAFKEKALDSVPFMLADESNAHTMDPERYRGDLADVRLAKEGEPPGLYGLFKFRDEQSAKAVKDNPNLGVSARIREQVQTSDGKTYKAALIHVLGTLDPQIRGMASWQPADVSLSRYDDNVLDLSSNDDEEEHDMGAKNTAVLDKDKALEDYTEADIDAMTEEQIDAFLGTFATDLVDSDDAEARQTDVDDDDEENEEDTVDENEGAEPELSHSGVNDVELANSIAAAANARATDALKRMAAAEWKAERAEYEAAGVPSFALDLAAPVLERSDDMVVDLSVTDDDDVNVSAVVRSLLDGFKGTVDLSNEQGHSRFDPADKNDPDNEILNAWNF